MPRNKIGFLLLASVASIVVLSTSACFFDSWATVTPFGTDIKLSLPKPIKHPKKKNCDVFGGAKVDGVEIWVTLYRRLSMSTQPGHSGAAEMLQRFVKESLQGLLTKLQKRYQTTWAYEKDIPVENGLGQQYRVTLSDGQFILNRFYITPTHLIHVKIDNGDESNPVVEKFFDSFEIR